MEPKVLTAQCIAERLSISADVVYKAARDGDLQCMTLPGRHVLCSQVQVDTYIELRRRQGKRDGHLTPADGLSARELAELIGSTPGTVATWKSKGKLHGEKVLGRLIFRWDEVRRFLEARGVDAEAQLAALRAEKEADAA